MVEIRDGGRSLLFGLFWEHIKYLFSVSIKDSKPGERLEMIRVMGCLSRP